MGFGPMNNRRYSERHELEIVALYEGGLSLYGVEKATSVPYGTVWDILQRRGVKCRSRKEQKPWQDPIDTLLLVRTAWLHQQGLTYKQIGKIMGLKAGGVRYRIRAARDRIGYKGPSSRGHNNRPKAVIPGHVQRAVAAWGIGGED